jgi:outer membrane protein OmpA-like peptidoglycan-associated protein
MAHIISHFWPWLLAIFVAGIATAILTRQAEAKGKVAPWLIWCGLAFAVGVLTALLNVLLGRAGLWLETALASFAVYMIGASAGALSRKGDLAEHKGWALGLIPAALLWFAGNVFGTPNIEAELKQSVGAAIKDARENAGNFRVVGRDVFLPNNVADRAALAATIGKVDGVRLVIGTDKIFAETPVVRTVEQAVEAGEAAAEKAVDAGKKAAATGWADSGKAAHDVATKAADAGKEAATAAEKAVDAGKKAVATGWAERGKVAQNIATKAAEAGKEVATATEKAVDAGKKAVTGWADPGKVAHDGSTKPTDAGKVVADQTKTAAEKAAAAKSALKSLPVSGPLDAAACQTALNATLVLDKIEFRSGGVAIRRASAYVLDRLAALLQRCPDQKVEIGGHTDNVGDDEDNQALSQRRADKVVRYLINEGVAAARLTGVGYGAKKPIASNDDEAGRAENRRIEFILK